MDGHKDQDEIFEEMEKLTEEILYHADLFFNKDRQEIPNHVYDEKVARWNELAEARPDLAELFEIHNKPVPIHVPTNQGLLVVELKEPMLSLKKAHTLAEMEAFDNSIGGEPTTDEFKMDGLALEIHYVNHKRGPMYSRGDGFVGEDVTHAANLFWDIPDTIPDYLPDLFIVRGEGAVSYEDFHLYNDTAVVERSNPRNAVSGWVRALPQNQDKAVKGLLKFFIYYSNDELGCEDYDELREAWKNLGFTLPFKASHKDILENNERDDFPVDGVVRKVKNLAKQKELGSNNRHPKWAIAYKFPQEEYVTPLKAVFWQTGKTGVVTPVGAYEPVRINGVVCNRASLHNYRNFMALGLREDSTVSISRNGDVIPGVNCVVNHGVGKPLKAPTECISCGSVLQLKVTKNSADLYCENVTECPAQLVRRCIELVSRRCLNIDGLGPVQLGQLCNDLVIQTPRDIFRLNEFHVSPRVLDNIHRAREQPLFQAINALGLPGVMRTRAIKLANACPEEAPEKILDWLQQASNIMKVPGFSAGLAMPIAKAMSGGPVRAAAFQLLMELKIIPKSDVSEPYTVKGSITGELGHKRAELIDYFADHGIELEDKLTKDCEFLIIGEKPSQAKVLKATETGIRMLNGTQMDSIDTLIKHIIGEKVSG